MKLVTRRRGGILIAYCDRVLCKEAIVNHGQHLIRNVAIRLEQIRKLRHSKVRVLGARAPPQLANCIDLLLDTPGRFLRAFHHFGCSYSATLESQTAYRGKSSR